jgi:hypothetical protein
MDAVTKRPRKSKDTWGDKFSKFFNESVSDEHWLKKGISLEDWMRHWNVTRNKLSKDKSERKDERVLLAFESLFKNGNKNTFQMQNMEMEMEMRVQFTFTIEIGTIRSHYEWKTPIVKECVVKRWDKKENKWDYVYPADDIRYYIDHRVLTDLKYSHFFPKPDEFEVFDDEDYAMQIELSEKLWNDAIYAIYILQSRGYTMIGSDSPPTRIECAACNLPNPKTVCGCCEQIAYCGQKCADIHWNMHKCK